MQNVIKTARLFVASHRQFVLYAIIGMSGVVLDFVIYTALVELAHVPPVIANFISISLAILNNFLLNRHFTFKVHDHMWKRFAFFYGVGFLGILLSDMLLVVLHYGLNMNPVLAKLLTLPVILIAQYGLNKKLSFGAMDETLAGLRRALHHWPAYVITVIFAAWSLSFVHYIPANFSIQGSPSFAPDEQAHFNFNVGFILKKHRLPVSGKDDLSAYTSCRDNPSGEVTCLYSYVFYPGASYVVDAATAGVLSKTLGIHPEVGSRVPGVFYGIVFILCAYFCAYLISRRRLTATLLAAAVGLLPQFVFTMSYTNLDAHSVGISGLLGLALVMFIQAPASRKRILFLAVMAGGFLPLAKYNFYVLALPVLVALIYTKRKQLITWPQLRLFAYGAVAGFIVLASFWFIRSTILYHDPLGQSFALREMSKHHWLGKPHAFDFQSFALFARMSFGEILFRSFYLAFGGMFFYLQEYQYTALAVLDVLALALGGYLVADAANIFKRRKLLIASLLYGAIFALTFGLVLYNSLVYDFQPQGRYMFPVLISTVIYLAYCSRLDKRFNLINVALAGGTLYMFINGLTLFMKVYFNG